MAKSHQAWWSSSILWWRLWKSSENLGALLILRSWLQSKTINRQKVIRSPQPVDNGARPPAHSPTLTVAHALASSRPPAHRAVRPRAGAPAWVHSRCVQGSHAWGVLAFPLARLCPPTSSCCSPAPSRLLSHAAYVRACGARTISRTGAYARARVRGSGWSAQWAHTQLFYWITPPAQEFNTLWNSTHVFSSNRIHASVWKLEKNFLVLL